jgi:hypothetical protein
MINTIYHLSFVMFDEERYTRSAAVLFFSAAVTRASIVAKRAVSDFFRALSNCELIVSNCITLACIVVTRF